MMRQESRDSAVIGGGGDTGLLLGWGRFQICATSKGDSGNWGWGLGLGKLRSAEALPLCPPAHGRWAEACHPVPPRQEVSPELQPSSVCRWGIAHTHHHEEPGPVQWAE